jgi:hypothetical protein
VGGHEFVGDIVAIGAGVVGFAEGDRIVAPFVCGCGECEPCRLGQHQVCRRQQQPGFTRWGAFAEYITCDPFNCKVLPPHFPKLEISLIEILPGVIHAAELAKITPHTNVLIMGQGVSGLVMTQVVRLSSPRVLAVTDLKPRNLLVNSDCHLRVADFGLARSYMMDGAAPLTNRVITLWYRPPELLLGATKYGPEVDMWCVASFARCRRVLLLLCCLAIAHCFALL